MQVHTLKFDMLSSADFGQGITIDFLAINDALAVQACLFYMSRQRQACDHVTACACDIRLHVMRLHLYLFFFLSEGIQDYVCTDQTLHY